MTYKIVSYRVGRVGDIFEPVEGVNIEALLEQGFIEETNTTPAKSDKIATDKE